MFIEIVLGSAKNSSHIVEEGSQSFFLRYPTRFRYFHYQAFLFVQSDGIKDCTATFHKYPTPSILVNVRREFS